MDERCWMMSRGCSEPISSRRSLGATRGGKSKIDETDRFFDGPTRWPGDSRRGEADVRAERVPHAFGHGGGDFGADRPMGFDQGGATPRNSVLAWLA